MLCFYDNDNPYYVDSISYDEEGGVFLSLGHITKYDISSVCDRLESYPSESPIHVRLEESNPVYGIRGGSFVDDDNQVSFNIYVDSDYENLCQTQNDKNLLNNAKYEQHYSKEGLDSTIGKNASRLGVKTVYMVLWLYYAISYVPLASKAIILGALGYLISPIDLISDLIPFVGFTDDIAVIAAAFAVVTGLLCSADSKVVADKAKAKLRTIFPNFKDSDLN